jgi:hypothetical protein
VNDRPTGPNPVKDTLPRPRAAAPAAPDAKTPAVCKELDVLIRARYPIIYVVSWEEERVEQQLAEIARQRNKKFYVWTLTQGLVKQGAATGPAGKGNSTIDPVQAINQVIDHVDPAIFLFKDFHPHMQEAVG